MASVTHITLTDDLDQTSQADETVVYAFDGGYYEIDLTTEHASDLQNELRKYASFGRVVSNATAQEPRSPRPKVRRTRKNKVYDAKLVRVWARDQGFEVSDRGRLHDELVSKYMEAHNLA